MNNEGEVVKKKPARRRRRAKKEEPKIEEPKAEESKVFADDENSDEDLGDEEIFSFKDEPKEEKKEKREEAEKVVPETVAPENTAPVWPVDALGPQDQFYGQAQYPPQQYDPNYPQAPQYPQYPQDQYAQPQQPQYYDPNYQQVPQYPQYSQYPQDQYAQPQQPQYYDPNYQQVPQYPQYQEPYAPPVAEPVVETMSEPVAEQVVEPAIETAVEPDLPPSTYEANKDVELEPVEENDQFKDTPVVEEEKVDDLEQPEVREVDASAEESVDSGDAIEAEALNVGDDNLGGGGAGGGGNADSADDPNENFSEDFWGMLEQAGITKRHLYMILFGIFGLIFASAFFFFGWYKVFYFAGGSDTPAEEQSDEVESQDVSSDVTNNSGITSSYTFGLEFGQPESPIVVVPPGTYGTTDGMRAALAFGHSTLKDKSQFAKYVAVLRDLRNMYRTDLYQLLDRSTDRRATLEAHIRQLGELIAQGEKNLVTIEEFMAGLDTTYGELIDQKLVYEESFFVALDQFYGQSAYEQMNQFIDYSQQAVEIKAYYSSYKQVRDTYVEYLAALSARYEDITANTDALIKGVKVFDLPDSDIDAIVPIEN